MNGNILRDCLNNLSLSENENHNMTDLQREYYKGLLVGITSSLMELKNLPFDVALIECLNYLPNGHILLSQVLPKSWLSLFQSLPLWGEGP